MCVCTLILNCTTPWFCFCKPMALCLLDPLVCKHLIETTVTKPGERGYCFQTHARMWDLFLSENCHKNICLSKSLLSWAKILRRRELTGRFHSSVFQHWQAAVFHSSINIIVSVKFIRLRGFGKWALMGSTVWQAGAADRTDTSFPVQSMLFLRVSPCWPGAAGQPWLGQPVPCRAVLSELSCAALKLLKLKEPYPRLFRRVIWLGATQIQSVAFSDIIRAPRIS